MKKPNGAYNCSYCHGNPDNACTACDAECNCIEIAQEEDGAMIAEAQVERYWKEEDGQ